MQNITAPATALATALRVTAEGGRPDAVSLPRGAVVTVQLTSGDTWTVTYQGRDYTAPRAAVWAATSPAPASADDAYTCDMPDGCGAGPGQPCEVGCPSMATDEYDEAFPSDEEPDRAPSADQERAWNAQYDGTGFGA